MTDSQKTAPENDAALRAISQARTAKDRIVFTNGCFDLLHIGHTRYLAEAKQLGSFLVVGLNSDASVKRLKGDERPIVSQAERREVLLALRAVDAVCIFDDDTPLELIKTVRPDFLVKGGDWPIEKIVGSDFVRSYGGQVKSLPFYQGHSSSNLVEKIRRL